MILLIDNYDSFTYNLVQLLREAGADVEVVRNDVETVPDLLARGPQGIVLSPGPGRPEDAGVCLDLLAARPQVPILGVCLGHQCLGQAWGATVDRAPRLMHGKTSMVRYEDDPLFAGLPNPFQATRYHSLCVLESTVPDDLRPIAWSTGEEGTVMAMRHRDLPYWGVQFHPESVLTPSGISMLRNFLDLCGVELSTTPAAPLVEEADLVAAGVLP
ncbi:MAG: aminodeoxychorismate/anthranilate synthase component II [Acidobacteriota bacterium]